MTNTQQRNPSDYRELKRYLKEDEVDEVYNMELDRRGIAGGDGDLYLKIETDKAGIHFWKLHDNFDVDVVSCWMDPVTERLDICLRLRMED